MKYFLSQKSAKKCKKLRKKGENLRILNKEENKIMKFYIPHIIIEKKIEIEVNPSEPRYVLTSVLSNLRIYKIIFNLLITVPNFIPNLMLRKLHD